MKGGWKIAPIDLPKIGRERTLRRVILKIKVVNINGGDLLDHRSNPFLASCKLLLSCNKNNLRKN